MYRLTAALSLLVILSSPGCRQSEIDNKPAAEIIEPSGTAPSPSATPADVITANVIKEKSAIEFVGAKVTRDHDGRFPQFDGTIQYVGGKPSSVSFQIDLASLETDTPKLTSHLKTADFFDVAKYPKATFVSTSLQEAPPGSPAGTTHLLRGTLDLHGVKKDVSIPVSTQITDEGLRARSEFTLNRQDWGISYRGMADDLVKDEVLIKLNLLFPPPAAA